MENQLMHFNKARQEIALAKDIDEVKDIRDKAEALRTYAKQAGESLEMQNQCAEIKIRAERKAGEMIPEEITKGGNPKLHDVTLKDLGIERIQSHRWQKIASIPENKFEEHLDETIEAKEELTTSEFLKYSTKLNQENNRSAMRERPLPKNKYQIIYADPPWEYRNSGFSMSAGQKYPTMNLEKIKELDVKKLADDNCILFLWVTNPLLKDAFEVIDSWGFEYKTNMVWIKKVHTAGFYVFGQHELLLISTKGQMTDIEIKPKSLIYGENKIHSKKPDCVYEIIEKMYPKFNHIELFARKTRESWDSWGNEIPEN